MREAPRLTKGDMRIRGAGERGRERWLAGLFNKVKRLSSTRAKLWRGRRSRSVGRRRSYKRQLTQADSRSSTANRRLIASAESERREPRTSAPPAHMLLFLYRTVENNVWLSIPISRRKICRGGRASEEDPSGWAPHSPITYVHDANAKGRLALA